MVHTGQTNTASRETVRVRVGHVSVGSQRRDLGSTQGAADDVTHHVEANEIAVAKERRGIDGNRTYIMSLVRRDMKRK